MKSTSIITLAAIALAAVGCASQTDGTEETEETPAVEEGEAIGQRSDALRNNGGGELPDRDTCEASRAGCYTACGKGGGASCYAFCDRQYAQCRGLPPLDLAIF